MACECSLCKEIRLLRDLINELLIVRDRQPCLRTANGIPMGMGQAKERRVRKTLKSLKELGVTFGPAEERGK